MKKIMIALVAAAIAGIAQAATCTWGSGALRTATSAAGGWSSTTVNAAGYEVSMSIYLIDATTYNSLSSASQADLFAAYSTKTADLTGVNRNPSTSALIGAITINEANSAASDQYAVAIATYTDSTYGSMYMATRVKAAFNEGTQKGTAANMMSSVGNWQSVPEPTSGLLVLLGVAGLALRRRRA